LPSKFTYTAISGVKGAEISTKTGGEWTQRCEAWLKEDCGAEALLTPSCTAALEAAVMLSGVTYGDEVILPSFAYPTCASSIIRAGGIPVFVDIKLDTLNIDPRWVRAAITNKTKAVMAIWYAGHPEQQELVEICKERGVKLIEDAAQCIGNFKLAGDFGALSFHYSKNISCGEGGALLVKNEYVEKARTLCACGTNRWQDKTDWTWKGVGSSYLMSEQLAEILCWKNYAVERITRQRIVNWHIYHSTINAEEKAQSAANGHIFWFLSKDRERLMKEIPSLVKHYEALHLCAPAKHGYTHGTPENSIRAANEIVRPTMNLSPEETLDLALKIRSLL